MAPIRDTITADSDTTTITTVAAATAATTDIDGTVNDSVKDDIGDPGVHVRGGMVLLNGDDVLVDMPSGNLVTDDVSISVAM